MRFEFKHRFTNEILHAEDVPDDSPNPMRTALEQAAMRGRPADELRDLTPEQSAALRAHLERAEHDVAVGRLCPGKERADA